MSPHVGFFFRRFLCLVASVVALALFLRSASNSPGAVANADAYASPSLQALCFSGGKAQVAYHAKTYKVRFVGTEAGERIARPASLTASASAEEIARGYLAACGSLFGLKDQSAELTILRQKQLGDGRSVVRFQQVYQGVPVMGGELIAQVDSAKEIISLNGEVLPDIAISTAPAIPPQSAQEKALQAIAKTYQLDASRFKTTEPELWIYNPLLLGSPKLPRTSLVWRMQVTPLELHPIRELVLVDAQLGIVALHFNELDTAKFRKIYDNQNNNAYGLPGPNLVRSEGGGATGITDADKAYDYAGNTYDFFFNHFGRDSIDGAGMLLTQTVRYCPTPGQGGCPYSNAFWNGRQMVYGNGFAASDDVVAHEMAHGVTEHEAHLFYYYQSGAINEALSDIFGEFMDLTNGAGNDTSGVRWLMGEDLPIGAIRSMSDPPAYGDPDKMTSANYTCDTSELDNGGVHTNSGVANKAAYLLADGGSFNGQTVSALGITKTAHIFYEAQTNLLTSAADYQDLFNSLQQACFNRLGVAGITSGDCDQVRKAVLATEMNLQAPSCTAPEVPRPLCPASTYPLYRFFDSLENPAAGLWTSAAASGTNSWYYPQTSNPFNFDATYATSGQYNFWGYNRSTTADYHIRMNSDVALPAASQPYLIFNHAYGFEDDASFAYDGGVLEYSTTGGAGWNDAASLSPTNGYNGTISNSFGNPLGGRSAFVRESNGYISSRFNLASLAGQNVRFRFRIGTDSLVDDFGWFIDDIGIYTCTDKAVFLPLIRR